MIPVEISQFRVLAYRSRQIAEFGQRCSFASKLSIGIIYGRRPPPRLTPDEPRFYPVNMIIPAGDRLCCCMLAPPCG
jgi:hypothetical protein